MRKSIIVLSIGLLMLVFKSNTQTLVSGSLIQQQVVSDSSRIEPALLKLLQDSNQRKYLIRNGHFNASRAALMLPK